MLEELKGRLLAIAEPMAQADGIEIIELKIHPRTTMLSIDITADKIAGRITIDECAKLNKQLSWAIEEGSLITGDWSVEVSSPGLDRPLKTMNDFKRMIGKDVRLHLTEKVEGKIEYGGIVETIDQEYLHLLTSKGQKVKIPFNLIHLGKHLF